MIWFTCKNCDKTHGRPESSIGATIFCDCGAGLVVPWESTAPEPPAAAAAPADQPAALKLEPVTFDAAPPARPEPPPLRGRKKGRLSRRDPQMCFNHESVTRQGSCADCCESFCADCLVDFAGASLCGPCKNYRVKHLQQAIPASSLSILSMLIAMLTGPFTIALLPTGRPGFPWWSLIAMLPQGLALALALLALREVRRDPKTGGQSLALTGLVSAGVTAVVIILLTMYVPQRWT